MPTLLVPNQTRLYEQGLNVMLVGLHGVGKTETLYQMANDMGIKMVSFSCATLDPYTDLVGVPVPEAGDLRMIRPHRIDEAELIFFDELNRAPKPVLNAVLEIIQSKRINGEPLPNLQACWAAINPDSDVYDTEALDPALCDRFDVFAEIKPQPSHAYMVEHGIEDRTAAVMIAWWNDHHRAWMKQPAEKRTIDRYVSPRRLFRMCRIWDLYQSKNMLELCMPMSDVPWDVRAIVQELMSNEQEGFGGTPHPTIKRIKDAKGSPTSKRRQIAYKEAEIVEILADQSNQSNHEIIASILADKAGSTSLVSDFGTILNALTPMILEGMFSNFSASKLSGMRDRLRDIMSAEPETARLLGNLHSQLRYAKDGADLLGPLP